MVEHLPTRVKDSTNCLLDVTKRCLSVLIYFFLLILAANRWRKSTMCICIILKLHDERARSDLETQRWASDGGDCVRPLGSDRDVAGGGVNGWQPRLYLCIPRLVFLWVLVPRYIY